MKRTFMLMAAILLGFSGAAASMAADESDELAEVKAGLAKAKVTLAQAVQAALKKVPGGKAVQAALEVDDDEAQFSVEIIAADGKHTAVEVDAIEGTAEDVEEETDEAGDDAAAEVAAAKANTPLLQAVEAAQKRVPGGKPFEASAEMEDGQLVFAVEFLSGDKIMNVEVDPATGKVLKVEEEK